MRQRRALAIDQVQPSFEAHFFHRNSHQQPAFYFSLRRQLRYRGASILVVGKNFGCGSSREHAPWALDDYGIRAIIGPSFSDIFANNCLKNGLLPIVLHEPEVAELMRRANEFEQYQATVNLERRLVKDDHGFSAGFAIGEFQRYCLLEGLDDIGLTLKHQTDIASYEEQRPGWMAAGISPEQTV